MPSVDALGALGGEARGRNGSCDVSADHNPSYPISSAGVAEADGADWIETDSTVDAHRRTLIRPARLHGVDPLSSSRLTSALVAQEALESAANSSPVGNVPTVASRVAFGGVDACSSFGPWRCARGCWRSARRPGAAALSAAARSGDESNVRPGHGGQAFDEDAALASGNGMAET